MKILADVFFSDDSGWVLRFKALDTWIPPVENESAEQSVDFRAWELVEGLQIMETWDRHPGAALCILCGDQQANFESFSTRAHLFKFSRMPLSHRESENSGAWSHPCKMAGTGYKKQTCAPATAIGRRRARLTISRLLLLGYFINFTSLTSSTSHPCFRYAYKCQQLCLRLSGNYALRLCEFSPGTPCQLRHTLCITTWYRQRPTI